MSNYLERQNKSNYIGASNRRGIHLPQGHFAEPGLPTSEDVFRKLMLTPAFKELPPKLKFFYLMSAIPIIFSLVPAFGNSVGGRQFSSTPDSHHSDGTSISGPHSDARISSSDDSQQTLSNDRQASIGEGKNHLKDNPFTSNQARHRHAKIAPQQIVDECPSEVVKCGKLSDNKYSVGIQNPGMKVSLDFLQAQKLSDLIIINTNGNSVDLLYYLLGNNYNSRPDWSSFSREYNIIRMNNADYIDIYPGMGIYIELDSFKTYIQSVFSADQSVAAVSQPATDLSTSPAVVESNPPVVDQSLATPVTENQDNSALVTSPATQEAEVVLVQENNVEPEKPIINHEGPISDNNFNLLKDIRDILKIAWKYGKYPVGAIGVGAVLFMALGFSRRKDDGEVEWDPQPVNSEQKSAPPEITVVQPSERGSGNSDDETRKNIIDLGHQAGTEYGLFKARIASYPDHGGYPSKAKVHEEEQSIRMKHGQPYVLRIDARRGVSPAEAAEEGYLIAFNWILSKLGL